MRVVLVGAGRYGKSYVDYLLQKTIRDVEFVGVVEKNIQFSPSKEDLFKASIPIYESMESFYACSHADLVMICTPPFLHAEQSICAVKHGSNVLCEKPAAPTVEQVKAMIEAEEETGKFIAIGYQLPFNNAILALKQDILNGVMGKALGLKAIISTPRSRAYYAPAWSGRVCKDGVMIMDSITFNACAHYIHSMLFLLGESLDESAYPDTIEAECYCANDIETYDTCVLRMTMASGTNLFFAASHATELVRGPEFSFTFENAAVNYCYSSCGGHLTAVFHDGTTKDYGVLDYGMEKIDICIQDALAGRNPVCTAKTALAHTRLVEDIYKHVPVHRFSADKLYLSGDTIFTQGFPDLLNRAYENAAMLSELDPAFKSTKFHT